MIISFMKACCCIWACAWACCCCICNWNIIICNMHCSLCSSNLIQWSSLSSSLLDYHSNCSLTCSVAIINMIWLNEGSSSLQLCLLLWVNNIKPLLDVMLSVWLFTSWNFKECIHWMMMWSVKLKHKKLNVRSNSPLGEVYCMQCIVDVLLLHQTHYIALHPHCCTVLLLCHCPKFQINHCLVRTTPLQIQLHHQFFYDQFTYSPCLANVLWHVWITFGDASFCKFIKLLFQLLISAIQLWEVQAVPSSNKISFHSWDRKHILHFLKQNIYLPGSIIYTT